MDSQRRKPGRPKGSKDGPRRPGAGPRGRPKKSILSLGKSGVNVNSDADDEYNLDDEAMPAGFWDEIDQIEERAQVAHDNDRTPGVRLLPPSALQSGIHGNLQPGRNVAPPNPASTSTTTLHKCTPVTSTAPPISGATTTDTELLRHLHNVANCSQSQPFFNHHKAFDYASKNDEDVESEKEEDIGDREGLTQPGTDIQAAWFKQPKSMPKWLYKYFAEVVSSLIFNKDGRHLVKPVTYSDPSPSFWVLPPDPVFSLSHHKFNPSILYRPRIFLWLVHFFVDILYCPNCKHGILEKNGALPPRRIIDSEDSFYIVTWAYYCRKGCKSHFHGWSSKILNSLPPYLRMAFPAVLSRKSGLSHRVITQLRVCNQHKMGPSGVRSLLLEMHTLRFNTLQVQYMEAAFELVCARQADSVDNVQSTLHAYMSTQLLAFGNFSDPQNYAGCVPSERYLAEMMNKSIEADEEDANQHTACLAPDQIAIDDSHKVNKHIARVEGIPVFGALWTCMDSRYIRAQALTLTKAHEERMGPLTAVANSVKLYGYDEPPVAFSDDPVKDKKMLCTAFPSLSKNLVPMAVAHGLTALELPSALKICQLNSVELVETAMSSLLAPLDEDPSAHICVSFDAEWNFSRHVGVSIIQIAPHAEPNIVYIIPVHKFGNKLPPSLLRILISTQIFKIGSAIKGDLTRLKKQFYQLSDQSSFNLIDLKEYCIDRGIIKRKDSGTLENLVRKTLHKFLSKESHLRVHEEWEAKVLAPEILRYAALDVFASRLVFEKAREMLPLKRPSIETPSGTRITLLAEEGGDPVAYGKVSSSQPFSLGVIRVKTPSQNRLVVDISMVLKPSVAAILHLQPSQSNTGKTKSGAFTLGQLQAFSGSSETFQVVSPLSLLEFDLRNDSEPDTMQAPVKTSKAAADAAIRPSDINEASDAEDDDADTGTLMEHEETDQVQLDMLQAHALVTDLGRSEDKKGKKQQLSADISDDLDSTLVSNLKNILESPSDMEHEYTRIKKDIFHAFHMIPTPLNHGMRSAFLRALRDHIMRWDPESRNTVDITCRRVFNLSFDQMLIQNPRFIAERTPRHIPSPSVLVAAISHVYNTFGNALDAKTGAPLFNNLSWQKAHAVLDLAREGYLSDPIGIVLYERAGLDKYGLQKWKCLRGTNNVEGGPHTGPRFTVNCLTDHRTWYNLQAYAKHMFGVDWDYHHNLGLINRTSFLLTYLSDVIDGSDTYRDWMNCDLYEKTAEKFGICKFPESLRIRLSMESYDSNMPASSKLSPSDNWLRKRQGLALPVLPPNTPEARRYFFQKIRHFAALASNNGKGKINYEEFAKEWNCSADGKDRCYVTTEVLVAYAKTWEKSSNVRASQELISGQMKVIQQTADVFAAPAQTFPASIKANPTSIHPRQAVVEIDESSAQVPASLSIMLAPSHPRITTLSDRIESPRSSSLHTVDLSSSSSRSHTPHSELNTMRSNPDSRPSKRRRVIPDNQRKRKNIRTCRRCRNSDCPGNSDILNCLVECTVACKKCGRFTGCRGVDNGKLCTSQLNIS